MKSPSKKASTCFYIKHGMVIRQFDVPADKWVRASDLMNANLERPVCIVNGAFDILHSSHLRLVYEAKKRAKTVIACLDSDEKVRRTKGEGRPVFYWTERATSLVYLGVDWVVEIDTDHDFVEVVNSVEPDFRILGAEYRGKKSRIGSIVPTLYIREGSTHTSDIIGRILSHANRWTCSERSFGGDCPVAKNGYRIDVRTA